MSRNENPRPLAGDAGAGKIGERDDADLTTTDSAREVLIDFAISIDRERRRLAGQLAARFHDCPVAATPFRHQLYDLRMLGREIGRVAFSAEVRS